MCDQTELLYHDGDVVWVKIGPIWWPGVVKDIAKEGKEDEVLGGLKTKPIAIVQFFDEDKYEFVKNLENIYHYNCRRKDEFIKKGLDKCRSGAKHMAKFPEDVGKAEELVDGDVNIVNDPKFAPQEKANYNDIFGAPKKKGKKGEETQLKTKFLPIKKRLPAPLSRHSNTPVKRRFDPSTPRGPLVEPGALYDCPSCGFSSHFISGLSDHISIAHSSSSKIDYSHGGRRAIPEPRRQRTPGTASGRKKARPVKRKEEPLGDDKAKASSSKTPTKRPPIAPTSSHDKGSEKKKRFTDALLADWSEDDDTGKEDDEHDDGTGKEGENSVTDLNENVSSLDVNPDDKSLQAKPTKETEPAPELNSSESIDGNENGEKKDMVSCFDFDEDEDGFIGMSNANTYGRKIPRVIPVKDKTDLGMDLDIDEIFKRKPDSERGDGSEVEEEVIESEPVKKRRGRPPKNQQSPVLSKVVPQALKSPVKTPTKQKETLAFTRERRAGSKKSYLNEVIEKVDESGVVIHESDDGEVPKPSRRKQDLKRQSLKELDDIESLAALKKAQPTFIVRKKDGNDKRKISVSEEDSEALTAQVESLLAETPAPVLPAAPFLSKKRTTSREEYDEELMESTIEYLEDDPEPVVPPSPVKNVQSPIKKWKDEIRMALEGEPTIKKSVQQPLKDVIIEAKTATTETPSNNIIQLSNKYSGQKQLIILQQQRPKILGKSQQQVVIVPKTQQRVKVVTAANSSSFQSSSQPVLQILPDGKSVVKKVAMPKKYIQLSPRSSPQKFVISEKGRDKMHFIENYNGTGKTVLVKEVGAVTGAIGSGSTVIGARTKVVTTAGPSSISKSTPQKDQCVIRRAKGSDGKYTIVKRSVTTDKAYTMYQPRQRHVLLKRQKPAQVVAPEPAPVAEPAMIEQNVEVMQPQQQPQIVAMPVSADGQNTYVLVSYDDSGMMQPVDGSLLSYGVQQEDPNQLYESPAVDDLTPVYSSPGQDILAEALANTNVLESDMTTLISHVVHDQSVTQKPVMTSLDISSGVIPDTSGLLISSVVQETSTLQKPIMTAAEVPSSIVPDTSGLEPPPLPPTPTEEDVLMEEAEGGLMIAEQQTEEQEETIEQQEPQSEQSQTEVLQVEGQPNQGDFFIDDSQEGEEVNNFQSMPLLNEESTASEEPIGDQNFEVQGATLKNNEYLPTSTNPDLEPDQNQAISEETVLTFSSHNDGQEEAKEEKDSENQPPMPFITDEGFVTGEEPQPSQETEVSSTTGDTKDSIV